MCFASLLLADGMTHSMMDTNGSGMKDAEPTTARQHSEAGLDAFPSVDTVEGAVGVTGEASLSDPLNSLHYQVYEDPLAANLPRFPKLVPVASSLVDSGTGRFDLYVARAVQKHSVGSTGGPTARPFTASHGTSPGTPLFSPVRPSGRPGPRQRGGRNQQLQASVDKREMQDVYGDSLLSVNPVPLSSSLMLEGDEEVPTPNMTASDVVRLRWNPPVKLQPNGRLASRQGSLATSIGNDSFSSSKEEAFGVPIVTAGDAGPRVLTRYRSFREPKDAAQASSHAASRLGEPLQDVSDKLESLQTRSAALAKEVRFIATIGKHQEIEDGASPKNNQDSSGDRDSGVLRSLAAVFDNKRPSRSQNKQAKELKREMKRRLRADGNPIVVQFGSWEVRNGRLTQVPGKTIGNVMESTTKEKKEAPDQAKPQSAHTRLRMQRPTTSPAASSGIATFKCVSGSAIGQSVFPSYTLPDGRVVHVYYKDNVHEAVSHIHTCIALKGH